MPCRHAQKFSPLGIEFHEGARMNISIIGSGQIGSILARCFGVLGHQVFIANSHGPTSLIDFALETGANPVSAADAARSQNSKLASWNAWPMYGEFRSITQYAR